MIQFGIKLHNYNKGLADVCISSVDIDAISHKTAITAS